MSRRTVNLIEDAYSLAVYRFQCTPKWRLLARWYRKREWKILLDALTMAVKEDMT